MTGAPPAVVVAVPAHDEAELVGRCIASVQAAAQHARALVPGLVVRVVVAADSCGDATPSLAAAAGASVLPVHVRCVGAARDAAIAHGLALLAGHGDPATAWVATTDADTAVPADWLAAHLALAPRADVLVGTVDLLPGADRQLVRAWQERHELREDHRHIHGANLGMTAEAWRRLDGFGPRPLHEDVELVQRAQRLGLRVLFTDTTRVRTSPRVDNRVPAGFGGYVRALSEELAQP